MLRAGRASAWMLAAALALSPGVPALAHGSLHAQIEGVTRAIDGNPSDARLYLRRGELYRVHEEWDAALTDYARAAKLAPGDDAIDFLLGRALLEAGRPDAARAALDRYLARHPDDAGARVARARALRALDESAAAVSDYTKAIELAPRPDPDVYLERSRLEAASGDLAAALAGVDAGIARLGPVPALQDEALEIELRLGRTDAALARLDRMIAASPRKEALLARRGEILALAGRRDEARDAYLSALTAIAALPAGARRTKAINDLGSRVRAGLNAL